MVRGGVEKEGMDEEQRRQEVTEVINVLLMKWTYRHNNTQIECESFAFYNERESTNEFY